MFGKWFSLPFILASLLCSTRVICSEFDFEADESAPSAAFEEPEPSTQALSKDTQPNLPDSGPGSDTSLWSKYYYENYWKPPVPSLTEPPARDELSWESSK